MSATQKVSINTRNGEAYTRTIALRGLTLGSQHKTKLKLLSEINRLYDPNLSAEQWLGNALLHVQEYYMAETCLAVMKMPDASYRIFRAANGAAKSMLLGHALDESIGVHLLAIPPQNSIYYTHRAEWCIPSQSAELPSETMSNFGEAISHLLEVDSFASVPLHLHEQYIGRLYLTNCSEYFDGADMLFFATAVQPNKAANRTY